MNDFMPTYADDGGVFKNFDLNSVPSPCFVIDEARVEENLKILREVADKSGAKILAALKAFSCYGLAPLVNEYLHGVAASGLYEARLARDFYKGELATFGAAFHERDVDEILDLSDHVIFNSPQQKECFLPKAKHAKGLDVGLRINPEHREGHVEKYDPCAPCSRLGWPISKLQSANMVGVDGLHMHTLCEQGFQPLLNTWNAVKPKIEAFFPQLKWFNFGGGHLITQCDYGREGLIDFLKMTAHETHLQLYLEPGAAVVFNAGILVGEILDVTENSRPIAITDISATCHMPDVIEAPYRPKLLNEGGGYAYRLGGPSCLAGDVIGDYRFQGPLNVGDKIAFLDQAHYTMVKTHMFNGIPLPNIAIWNSKTNALRMWKQFSYDDFKARL